MQLSGSLSAHLIWRSLGLLSNLIITVLIARLLGAAASGQFFYLISNLTFVILICSMGLEPSITYFLASARLSKTYLLRLTGIWITGILILLFLISFMADRHIPLSLADKRSGLAFVAGQLMVSFFTAFFYGAHQFERPAKIICLSNLLYILGLLYYHLIVQQPVSFHQIMSSYAVLLLIQGLIMMGWVLYPPGFHTSDRPTNHTSIAQVFTYSLGIWITNLLFFLVTRIDYWILHYLDQPAASIGNYIQVSRIAQLFQLFPSMLAAFIFPSVASQKDQMISSISAISRLVLWLNILLIVFLILSGSFLFPFLFGKSFDEMYPLFLGLIPGILSLALLTIISPYFSGTNKVHINLSVSFIGLLGVCIGNVLLIPHYGVMAAAVVSSITYLLCFVITLWLFLRKTGISLADCMICKRSDFILIKTKIKFLRK